MLRKILSFFFALFMFLPTAHSAEMVNVEYIHQYLNARWGIDLPYNPELKNPKVAANMEYLLTVVDIANEYLNGEKTTSYGTGEYATNWRRIQLPRILRLIHWFVAPVFI